ncbi:MAG: hypothetical protein C4B58_04050 [Deltaproteobacteria bacterium]|nr:MAG: hypothetical protein C4B58_04050 [Deltaproteobacteria bacterium]
MVAGPRTFETALTLIQMTARIVLGIPCFFSDGFSSRLWPFFDYYKTRKIKELAARFGNYKHSYPDFLWVDLIQFKLDIIISVS